jgi:hypothetical protein
VGGIGGGLTGSGGVAVLHYGELLAGMDLLHFDVSYCEEAVHDHVELHGVAVAAAPGEGS